MPPVTGAMLCHKAGTLNPTLVEAVLYEGLAGFRGLVTFQGFRNVIPRVLVPLQY